MFVMSVKMTLATILVAGLLWISLNRVVRILRDLGSRTVDAKLELWRWTVEFLSAPRLLRLFNATDHARNVVNRARDQEIFTERKAEAIQAAIKPAIEAITVFGAGVFLIVGYLAAAEGARSAIPKLFVYVLIFYRLKPHIQAFNDFRHPESSLIVVPVFQGKRGNPVLFSREFREEILQHKGEGCRGILLKHPQCIREVMMKNDNVLRDIDTPEDYSLKS